MSFLPPRLRAIARRMGAVGLKEIRQLRRDRFSLGFVVAMPLAQLILFGFAINQDIRGIRAVVVDESGSSLAREVVGRLGATQTFRIVGATQSKQEAEELLVSGKVQAAVIVPAEFDRAYYRGRGAEISILLDASDPLLARAAFAAAQGLEQRLAHELGRSRRGAEALSGARADLVRDQPISLTVHNRFNRELRTPVFVVPGLLGVILTQTMIMMTALAVVRERERGTFEFLIGTPVSRLELMVGKILPYIGIGLVQVVLVLVAGLLLFRVPVAGSLVGLGLAAVLFIAANLALGLVVSAVTRTQYQATQLSFFIFLPSVLLSGFMFPFAAMPAWARAIGELLPLTHFIRISRGLMLRGADSAALWLDLAALALFCLIGVAVPARLFTKRLD